MLQELTPKEIALRMKQLATQIGDLASPKIQDFLSANHSKQERQQKIKELEEQLRAYREKINVLKHMEV